MGLTQSSTTVSDPSLFASPVDDTHNEDKPREYDYIIVGGGTAGCVLASRLSEDPNATVLLVEAGKSHEGDFPTSVPLAYGKLPRSEVDWDYVTTPQEGLGGRTIRWPRGKILGGSSAINAMLYHRCAPEDFDEWERLGGTGWNYADLRPYFDNAEHYTPSPWYPDPILNPILETGEKMGIPFNQDINSPRGTLGSARLVGCVDEHGRRTSSATAYLTPDVLKRPNLTVAVKTTVERILFQDASTKPRAIGVEVTTSRSSRSYRACASREVIVCAGAIVTPQLLLVSGLGPADDLQKLDIEVIRDIPAVGKNLADHLTTGPLRFRAQSDMTWDRYNQPLHGGIALLQWLITGKGPLSALSPSTAAFIRSDDPKLSLHWGDSMSPVRDGTSGPGAPDLELLWFPVLFGTQPDGVVELPSGQYGITMAASSLRPESTGQISLASSSIWDRPVIDANYYGSENDINVAVRATRLLLRMARTEPLASLLDWTHITGDDYFWPANADPNEVTDDALKDWLRKNSLPIFHPVSSARMGRDPQTSVVDHELRVHGVAGLRIVDASAFPAQVSGHPCAVIVAMAEKAAEFIKRAA